MYNNNKHHLNRRHELVNGFIQRGCCSSFLQVRQLSLKNKKEIIALQSLTRTICRLPADSLRNQIRHDENKLVQQKWNFIFTIIMNGLTDLDDCSNL